MRKFLLLTIVVFQLTNTFGQTSDWGSWVQNPCFVGLYTRFKKSDIYSEKYGRTWYVQFKNTYPEKIAFSFTSGDNPNDINDNIANQKKGYRTELSANSIDDGQMWVSEFNEEQCILGIGLLRFLSINETDVSKPYANCRGGEFCNYCAIRPVPGCPNYSNTTTNNIANENNGADTYDKKEFPDDDDGIEENSVSQATSTLKEIEKIIISYDHENFPNACLEYFKSKGFEYINFEKETYSNVNGVFVKYYELHFKEGNIRVGSGAGMTYVEMYFKDNLKFNEFVRLLGHSTNDIYVSRNSRTKFINVFSM